MFTRIKTNRLSAMAKVIQIPVSLNLRQDLANEIRKEVLHGYKTHDQMAFSTYLFIENAYFGCLRYSVDREHGPVIRLKMYNSVADDTRDYIEEINRRLGMETEAFFKLNVPETPLDLDMRLDTILDVWFDVQFRIDTTDTMASGHPHLLMKSGKVNPTTSGHVLYFVEVAKRAQMSDVEHAVLFFDEDDDFPVMKAIFRPGGGGQIWVCLVPVTYGKDSNIKKPALWRRCLKWDEASTTGIDFLRTEGILNAVISGNHRYNSLPIFPTALKATEVKEVCHG